MKHDQHQNEDQLQAALDALRDIPPPDEARRAAHRQELLAQVRRAHVAQAQRRQAPTLLNVARSRWVRMAAIVLAVIAAAVLATGGVAYAADASAPGDVLYGMDQALERAQLGLARSPEEAVNLQLAFAEERLQEAEQLTAEGDEENSAVAFRNYGQLVSTVAHMLNGQEDIDPETLAILLDQAFARHEERLRNINRIQQGSDDDPPQNGGPFCSGDAEHPVAKSLAETSSASYEDIMRWFCEEGYGIGEITLALETSQQDDVTATPDELLDMRNQQGGWGHVWQEMGLIGRPEDAGPPEDHPGNKPDDNPGNKPDTGQPDENPNNRPDHTGPPEDNPNNRPDDAGPPEDRPDNNNSGGGGRKTPTPAP